MSESMPVRLEACRVALQCDRQWSNYALYLHAKEDVRTTRLMLSVFLATLESTFLVPPTAGSINCFLGSVTSLIKGEAV